MKLYYLGPRGTYSEKAANYVKTKIDFDVDIVPISTIAKIVELAANDSEAFAILPIENSIEGIVRPTIDALYANDVLIRAQIEVEIRHCLFSKGKKEQIKHIMSHPQALAQCQKYILNNFDSQIELLSSTSTSAAIADLLNKDETYAAISSYETGIASNLNLIDENISDVLDNKTRFVLISKKDIKISNSSRTSIVFNTKNEPGALLNILTIFKKHDLNLIYLESRPSRKVFGEYNFFVDIDKGVQEIAHVLKEIENECNFYKFLGSYSVE